MVYANTISTIKMVVKNAGIFGFDKQVWGVTISFVSQYEQHLTVRADVLCIRTTECIDAHYVGRIIRQVGSFPCTLRHDKRNFLISFDSVLHNDYFRL